MELAYRFEAYQVCPDSRQLERDFLCMVASLEAHSDHPGKGLGGLVTLPNEHRPRAMLLGSRSFILENGLEIPELLETSAQQWAAEPNAVTVLGGWDGWVRGVLKFLALRVPA